MAGSPATGARKIQWETEIEYDYTAREGFEDLVVVLDGEELIESARSVLTAADKPAAFQAHLDRVGELVAEVGPEEARRRIEIVDFLAFDPAEDFEAMVEADLALANHVFDVNVPAGSGSASPDAAADASASVRPAAASGSEASAFDTTAIFYLNGIFNSPTDARNAMFDVTDVVVSAASDFSTENQVTKLFYNRTYEEQTDAEELRDAYCTADLDRVDGFLGAWQKVRHLAKCAEVTVDDFAENFDLIEAARQYLDVATLADFVPEEDVRALADTLDRRLDAGFNVVAVPHSQGNLMVQQALEIVNANTETSEQLPICAGVVSLAAPTSEGFPVQDVELEGLMIRHDILEHLPDRLGIPHEQFPPFDTELSRRADSVFQVAEEADAFALPSTVSQEQLARIRWGVQIHSASGSYLASPGSRQRIRDGLVAVDESLFGRCGSILDIRPDSVSLRVDETAGMRAFLAQPDGQLVTPVLDIEANWTSRDPGIASVDQDGLVFGQDPGTTEIVAESGSLVDTATVTVVGVGDFAGTWTGTWNNSGTFEETFTEGPMTLVVGGSAEPEGSISMTRRDGAYDGELPDRDFRDDSRAGDMDLELGAFGDPELVVSITVDTDSPVSDRRLIATLELEQGGTVLSGSWRECDTDLCRFGQREAIGNIELQRAD